MTRGLVPAIALLALALLAAGCVRQQRFRYVPSRTACFPETAKNAQDRAPADQKPSLDCRREQYKLAFIEFNQQGDMWDPKQADAAIKLLDSEKARSTTGKIITVVYVHGWKNNAAEALPGSKAKDVEKFQNALLELGYRAAKAADPPVPIVGIYIAWRGKTLMGPNWVTFASLWSRRNTANHVGDGDDLAPFLDQIIRHTNRRKGSTDSDDSNRDESSRVLLIGHSFGARVLEHAIESKKVRLFDEVKGDTVGRSRVDLVLYVNSANDSRLGMGRIQALQAAKLRIRHPDYNPDECSDTISVAVDADTLAARCRDYPLLVAISSKGDSATKYLLPIANTINSDKLSAAVAAKLPPLPTTGNFLDKMPSAGTVKKTATGHFGFLQSHTVHEISCPAAPIMTVRAASTEDAINAAVRKAVAEALGKTEDEAARAAAEAARRENENKRRFERAMHPVCSPTDKDCRFVFRTLGDKPVCYQVDQRQPDGERRPFNETPFWAMSVEPTVIKDHGDIWNVSFVEMLGQLMAPRGFFDPTSRRIQIRTGSEPTR